MTIATHAGFAAQPFHGFGIADSRGRGHAHVQAPPPYSRRAPDVVDDALRSATPANLLSRLGRAPLPKQFTPSQAHAVKHILDAYHPQTLAHSPVIDVRGNPMPLRLASTPLTDVRSGAAIPVRSPLERGVVDMFKNHTKHLQWEQAHFGVREIRPGEAEPALVGQEGVFAKKAIPAGTPVSIFGGMYLGTPADIELDSTVRAMAGMLPEKYRDRRVSETGGLLEAMGTTMKCNSAGNKANLLPLHINALGPSGEKIRLAALYAATDIEAGQELRMNYRVAP